jgi:hypothetical protein
VRDGTRLDGAHGVHINAIQELPQGEQGLHDERDGAMGAVQGGTTRGTMKTYKKVEFPQGAGLTGEYNLFGLRNAAVIQNPLIE